MSRDQDDVIDEAVVKIRPDLSTFQAELKTALAKQQKLRAQPTYKVKVVADGAGLKKSVADAVRAQMLLKNQPAYKVKVIADAKGLKKSIGDIGETTAKAAKKSENDLTKIHAAGVRERRKADREALNKSLAEGMAYGLKLQFKDIEKNLDRIRNVAEKHQRDEFAAREAEYKRENSRLRSLAEKAEQDLANAVAAERKRTRSRVRSEGEQDERDLAAAQIADRKRTNTQIRNEDERAEQQHGAALVDERKRTNSRVRNEDEASARIVEQARQVESTRNLQRARNADEALTASHLRALDEMTRDEEKAAAERTKILKAEEKRRKESLAPFRKGQKLIDLGGEGLKPMSLLYGAVVAMTPALFAMGASAAQASTSIAALGAAGIGAALGISAIGIAFNGIGDLLTLRKSVQNEATTKAANSARDAVNTADDLAQSKRNLADAQRDEKRANDDIHKARREAIRDLQDLRIAVRDLDNQYKSDQLTVAEKKRDALATDRNFFATALDRARAHQDVADAQTQLSDTALQRKRKKEDLRQSVSKGVEGSDKVRDAKERARDARDRTLDAQAALRKGAAGLGGGLDKTSSAAAQLNKKIKELAPAAREMYYWFLENEKLFKRLQKSIAQATLPGFNTFLKALTEKPKGGSSTLEIAARYAGELGAIIGKHVGEFGEFTQGPLFRGSMARIQKTNAAAFDKLGDALIKLADPITRILDKASPAFGAFADKVLELSTRFADFIEKADAKGDLADWFEKSRIEAKKWYDIAANIGTLLKNLFTAALPAGGSLVASFEQFIQSLADWSGSASGQKQIKDFFTKVENLPYAKIIDFFKNAGIFFVAFRAFTLLKGINPIFAAIGAFAAANPAAAAAAFSDIATSVGKIMGFFASNPEAAAGLLALVAGFKGLKAVGFSLKLPAMDRLQTALTSKFKFLDQFLGGGTKTGTMTVQAGVVYVNGGVGGVPGGRPGTPVVAGKAPGRVAGMGLGGVSFWAIVYEELINSDLSKKARQKTEGLFVQILAGAVSSVKPENLAERLKDPIGTMMRDAIGLAARLNNLGPAGPGGTLRKVGGPERAIATEGNAFRRLNRDLELTGGFDNAVAQASLKTYIDKRKQAVGAYVAWVKSEEGPVAAAEAQRVEDEKSKTALYNLYIQYGDTEEAARKYADAAFAVSEQSKIGTGWVKGFNDQLGTLKERIDAVTGVKQIILTIDGEKKVFASLEAAVLYQQAVRMGVEPNESKLRELKLKMDKNNDDPNLVDGRKKANTQKQAAGGMIRGYSPHDKADNIPAWLTANEYVQPVAAVKHYGTDFMEAVRTRRFPKFAAGGPVNQWPFDVKMPDALKPVQQYVEIGVPGTAPGQGYTGKVPRGIGDVSGVVGSVVAATLAAKRLFPALHVTSGLRKTRTPSGNISNHWYGHAVDLVPPSMALFEYLKGLYGKVAREIIYTPAGNRQVWHGRNHMYHDPRVRAMHYNHVHLALAEGGLVPRKYDSGGILPPGYSLAFNGTGQNETIRTDQQEKALGATRLDRRDLALLAQFMAGAVGNPTIAMDGRKVAETTNRYNYLPSGVS